MHSIPVIQYIKRKDLDKEKYDTCIAQSLNSRIYAFSWYLDAVADNWDVLIYGDYEAVMPLPWRRKWGIAYIYTPAWIQQLGIFFKVQLSEQHFLELMAAVPAKFKKISLLFNEQNFINHPQISVRNNFLLSLHDSYEQLFNNYQKNRHQALKNALEFETIIQFSTTPDAIIQLHQEFIQPKTHLKHTDMDHLKKLLSTLKIDSEVYYYESWFKNKLIGGAIFLKSGNRYYYLLSAVNEDGKKMQSMSLILNEFIKNHAGQNCFFDFEGSMIPGIASFFKSFGAEKVSYYFYQKPFDLF
jgi:hypothetical protein